VYIVTGAAGHLGSHIVKELLSQGKSVRALYLPEEKCPEFICENLHLLSKYYGDVRHSNSVERMFYGCQVKMFIVIHCAALISITNKENRKVYDVNVNGTNTVIEACKKFPVFRFVYVSSTHAIPLVPHGNVMREAQSFNPDNVTGYYDKTKAIAGQLVLDAASDGLNAVVVHPSGIIGPNGLPTGNMTKLIALYLCGKLPIAVKGGYDFVDVRDVATGVIEAADKGKNGECYILSNRFVKLKEMFDILFHAGAKRKQRIQLPFWVAKAIAPFAEIYYHFSNKTPLFTRYSLNTLLKNGIYSHEKASRDLNYKTRSITETLTDTAAWIKQNPQFYCKN